MSERVLLALIGAVVLMTAFAYTADCAVRAEAVAIDPRIIGGSERQRLVADWLLTIRPDLAAHVTEVRFVPRDSLWVNTIGHREHKAHCFIEEDGTPLTWGRCIGEAEWTTGKVRFAQEYSPPDVQLLLHAIAHEYVHPRLFAVCGLCATDEALTDACADDPTKCRRTP